VKFEVEFGHVVTKKVKILDYILYYMCSCLKKKTTTALKIKV